MMMKKNMITILFMSADPTDLSRIRVSEEAREIQEKLRLAKLRDDFHIEQRSAVRAEDISQALLDTRPDIVHFSGHGEASGALCIENRVGRMLSIEPNALASLFNQFSDHVKCVMLNACFSEKQAKAIARHIENVIGMNQAIEDKAAIAFSIGFYQALGGGFPIAKAFELGCTQIAMQGLPGKDIPVIITRTELKLTNDGEANLVLASDEKFEPTPMKSASRKLHLYKEVYKFAASSSGMNKLPSQAEAFAENWINEHSDTDFAVFKDAYRFATSSSGMNKLSSQAEAFAWKQVSEGHP